MRSLVSDCKSRLPRGIACNLLDIHAPTAYRERRLLRVQALRAAQCGRSCRKCYEGEELHGELLKRENTKLNDGNDDENDAKIRGEELASSKTLAR